MAEKVTEKAASTTTLTARKVALGSLAMRRAAISPGTRRLTRAMPRPASRHSQGPMVTKPMIVRMTNSGARLPRASLVSLSTTRRSGATASRPPMPAASGSARRADGGGRRPCRRN